jgi:hypothetical protein
VPKLAVLLASLASITLLSILYPHGNGLTLAVLAIPVMLSFWGWLGNERRRDAGFVIALFSLLVFFLSGWMWLSYLPGATALLVKQKGRDLRPDPSTPPNLLA